MRYEVVAQGDTVDIKITGVGDKVVDMLGSFQKCQSGQCGCPTDQYERLAEMDVEQSEDSLLITLRSKPEQLLDTDEISSCIDYSIDGAEQSE